MNGFYWISYFTVYLFQVRFVSPKIMALTDQDLLKEIAEDFWQWRLKDVPEFATACNIHLYNDKLESQTIDSFQSKVERCKEILKRLSKVAHHIILE